MGVAIMEGIKRMICCGKEVLPYGKFKSKPFVFQCSKCGRMKNNLIRK